MIANGRMMPSGLAKVEAAYQDGSWFRLGAVDSLEILQDLVEALMAYPNAERYFEALP